MLRRRRGWLGAFLTASFPCALALAFIGSEAAAYLAAPKATPVLVPTPSPDTAAPPTPNATPGSDAKRAPEQQQQSKPAPARKPAAAVKRTVRKKVARTKRRHGFRWPVYGWVTSNFGPRAGGFHHGLDVACRWGTPIIASHSGPVIYRARNYWYGKTIVIGSKTGWSTLYAHMNTTRVKVGQRVKQGQIIGTCGNTGVSTGNHLHFEVRKGGRYWNPRTVLP